jgi:hypothetical protein
MVDMIDTRDTYLIALARLFQIEDEDLANLADQFKQLYWLGRARIGLPEGPVDTTRAQTALIMRLSEYGVKNISFSESWSMGYGASWIVRFEFGDKVHFL